MTELTISLVALNQRHDLARLLPTLLPAAERMNAVVRVVDNRSTDGTGEFLALNYPDVHVHRHEAIAGYGENHNLNLALSQSRYFLIMNTDMVINEEHALVQLTEYMNSHSDVGLCTCKVLNPDGTIQGLNKRYPTAVDLFLRGFSPAPVQRVFQRRMDRYEMRDVGYDTECDVEFISGAFMFCRADVLRAVGGFDPGYFLYFEDTDLCRRIQKTHRTTYVPEVSAIHFWQRGAHKNARHRQIFLNSAVRYFNKWGYKVA